MADEPKERPILFREAMALAILNNRKTETRRIIKPQPIRGATWDAKSGLFIAERTRLGSVRECPYGWPGDRLWVRETHYRYGFWEPNTDPHDRRRVSFVTTSAEARYTDDPPPDPVKGFTGASGWYKRPSIFMKRSVCRAVLQIVGVRAERLQDMTRQGAMDEGVQYGLGGARGYAVEASGIGWAPTARQCFRSLWESIHRNTNNEWAANRWVWVVKFKRVIE